MKRRITYSNKDKLAIMRTGISDCLWTMYTSDDFMARETAVEWLKCLHGQKARYVVRQVEAARRNTTYKEF